MANVLIVIYLLIVLALIAVVLMQRSEGGALGIGGGGGNFQVRSKGDLLSRTTAVLAALFFATAIGLTVINEIDTSSSSILDSAAEGTSETEPGSVLDALNKLQGDDAASAPAEKAPETVPVAPAEDTPDLAVPQSSSGTPAN